MDKKSSLLMMICLLFVSWQLALAQEITINDINNQEQAVVSNVLPGLYSFDSCQLDLETVDTLSCENCQDLNPSCLDQYLEIDGKFYVADGSITINSGSLGYTGNALVNCQRENNQPITTNGDWELSYGNNSIALLANSLAKIKLSTIAEAFELTTLDSDIICDDFLVAIPHPGNQCSGDEADIIFCDSVEGVVFNN